MNKVVETSSQIENGIFGKMKEVKPMEIKTEKAQEFQSSTRWLICNQHVREGGEKVRDHGHFTGRYRGAAHVKCNSDYSFRYFNIPMLLTT